MPRFRFRKACLVNTFVISVIDDDASVRPRPIIFSAARIPVHTFEWPRHFASAHPNDSSYRYGCADAPYERLDLLTHMRSRGYTVPFIFITAFLKECPPAR